MTQELLTGFMVLDATIAVGLVWIFREVARLEREHSTIEAVFYGRTCRLKYGRWVDKD